MLPRVGAEDGSLPHSLARFGTRLIRCLPNHPLSRHNQALLHQACFQAFYHFCGSLSFHLPFTLKPPQHWLSLPGTSTMLSSRAALSPSTVPRDTSHRAVIHQIPPHHPAAEPDTELCFIPSFQPCSPQLSHPSQDPSPRSQAMLCSILQGGLEERRNCSGCAQRTSPNTTEGVSAPLGWKK